MSNKRHTRFKQLSSERSGAFSQIYTACSEAESLDYSLTVLEPEVTKFGLYFCYVWFGVQSVPMAAVCEQ